MKNNYFTFLNDIKERIKKSQYDALKSVNKELVNLYWDIGKMIHEKRERGKSIVENLAKDLQKENPGLKGFSSQNLWRMQNFYLIYTNNTKLAPLVREISWSNNILIMERCDNDLKREFYLKMTKKFGWTKNVLLNHIENESYEKYLLNQTNFDDSINEKYKPQAKLAVKDDYTFDFLGLEEEHSEKELEKALTEKIRNFLSEMGNYFCFISSQYRLELEGEEFFIDILLYHRKLKCLVAVELKIGDFKPEYTGKMQFYLSVLDDKIKLKDENPSIGIIICKNKKRTIVEYALKNTKKPIGVATYNLTESLPNNLLKYLPTKKDIEKRIKDL